MFPLIYKTAPHIVCEIVAVIQAGCLVLEEYNKVMHNIQYMSIQNRTIVYVTFYFILYIPSTEITTMNIKTIT
jgi:hypothetical protein